MLQRSYQLRWQKSRRAESRERTSSSMFDAARSRIRLSKHRFVWMQTAAIFLVLTLAREIGVALGQDLGTWELVVENAGIAAMHAAVTRYGTVVLLDRTNIGASQIALPDGNCRDSNDLVLKHDCTAHSVLFDPSTNTVRPLTILTDTWCSSGQFMPDGTLMQTGGDFEGVRKVRTFTPCPSSGTCDWVESTEYELESGRWYATNQLLPDGVQIIIGGRAAFNLEYMPPAAPTDQPLYFPFLNATNDAQNDNLYPFVHMLPDGTLYVFANQESIIYNYITNQVVKTFPTIPGNPRNYPSAGSSVMLPLLASNQFSVVEVMVCGGAQYGAFLQPWTNLPCSTTCERITVTDPNPVWVEEDMPIARCMGDMLLLPTTDVLIINGAQTGSQGWGNAQNPALNPVLYNTYGPYGARFTTLAPTTIPRMYHSTAVMLQVSSPLSNFVQLQSFPSEKRNPLHSRSVPRFNPTIGTVAGRSDSAGRQQHPPVLHIHGTIPHRASHRSVLPSLPGHGRGQSATHHQHLRAEHHIRHPLLPHHEHSHRPDRHSGNQPHERPIQHALLLPGPASPQPRRDQLDTSGAGQCVRGHCHCPAQPPACTPVLLPAVCGEPGHPQPRSMGATLIDTQTFQALTLILKSKTIKILIPWFWSLWSMIPATANLVTDPLAPIRMLRGCDFFLGFQLRFASRRSRSSREGDNVLIFCIMRDSVE